MARGVVRGGGRPHVILGSDGGDGLLEALAGSFSRWTSHQVVGPLGGAVTVRAGWLDPQAAVVESRLVCGLSLLAPQERSPLGTTTRGVGELVVQLRARGATHVFVGLGGSATMDGGLGMARAWGWVPRDRLGTMLPHGGGSLPTLATLEAGPPLGVRVTGLCDVRNPLLGRRGARVYAAQKGASAREVELLAHGLERLVEIAAAHGAVEMADRAGAGAAGGLGFGILCFGRGTLCGGAEWVLDHQGFQEALGGTDLVITGEGRFDATSLEGKLTGEVITRARAAGAAVTLLAPAAQAVPAGVAVRSGGGAWSAEDLEEHAYQAVVRRISLDGGVGPV